MLLEARETTSTNRKQNRDEWKLWGNVIGYIFGGIWICMWKDFFHKTKTSSESREPIWGRLFVSPHPHSVSLWERKEENTAAIYYTEMKEVDKQVDQRDFQIKQEKTSIIHNNNNKNTLAPLGLLKLDFLLSKILSQNSCIRVVSKGRRRQSKKVRGRLKEPRNIL